MTTDVTGFVLLPLDGEILRTRLDQDDFHLVRAFGDQSRKLHFGPEFPGDALVLYRRFSELFGDGVVEGTYVVVDLDADEVVGQLGTMGPPAGERVEIGYGINPAAWGRGIATWAVAELLTVLDAQPEVGEVVARTAVSNPASGRVLEKNGFAVTGRETSDDGELLVWGRSE
jgi:ribosomal-protein-alanine N-acetyltransferase